MMDIIEKLQQKPPKEKRRIALVISFVATLAIFLLWFSFFSVSRKIFPEDKELKNISSSFSIITENIGRAWSSIKENIGQMFGSTASSSALEKSSN